MHIYIYIYIYIICLHITEGAVEDCKRVHVYETTRLGALATVRKHRGRSTSPVSAGALRMSFSLSLVPSICPSLQRERHEPCHWRDTSHKSQPSSVRTEKQKHRTHPAVANRNTQKHTTTPHTTHADPTRYTPHARPHTTCPTPHHLPDRVSPSQLPHAIIVSTGREPARSGPESDIDGGSEGAKAMAQTPNPEVRL